MGHSGRLVRRLALAGVVAVAMPAGGVLTWRTASATTRVLDRSDSRFDMPVVEFGPAPGPSYACPTYTPVDATSGKPLGIWQHC